MIGTAPRPWLLMAHDRDEGDEFQITQEFLGLMRVFTDPREASSRAHSKGRA